MINFVVWVSFPGSHNALGNVCTREAAKALKEMKEKFGLAGMLQVGYTQLDTVHFFPNFFHQSCTSLQFVRHPTSRLQLQ